MKNHAIIQVDTTVQDGNGLPYAALYSAHPRRVGFLQTSSGAYIWKRVFLKERRNYRS